MFDHGNTRGRDDYRRDGGDIQHGPVGIAAGSDDIEHHRIHVERQRTAQDGITETDDLIDRLPFDP